VLKVGYREDAAPFSYKSEIGEAVGYSVDLCRTIATRLKADLALGRHRDIVDRGPFQGHQGRPY